MRILVLSCTFLLLCSTAGATEDVDRAKQIQNTLSQAVSKHSEAMTAARNQLLDEIDRAIVGTRTGKRLPVERRIARLRRLEAARGAFEERGVVPNLVEPGGLKRATSRYQRTRNVQMKRLVKAYELAADSYGETGDLEAAEVVLDELKAVRAAAAGQKPFLLEAGTIWQGLRTVSDPSGKSREIRYELHITDAKQGRFQGEFSFDGYRKESWTCEGVEQLRRVEMTEVGGGEYTMRVVGIFNNGTLAYQLEGVTAVGTKRRGSGILQRKK